MPPASTSSGRYFPTIKVKTYQRVEYQPARLLTASHPPSPPKQYPAGTGLRWHFALSRYLNIASLGSEGKGKNKISSNKANKNKPEVRFVHIPSNLRHWKEARMMGDSNKKTLYLETKVPFISASWRTRQCYSIGLAAQCFKITGRKWKTPINP